MKTYTKVRFIGYAVPTTASGLIPIGDVNGKGSDAGYYAGDSDNGADLEARVDILVNAVETAAAQLPSSPSDVINVFVAPEFFFRGVYGPYLWNSATDEDPFATLQSLLESKLASYTDWIFFCGSVVTLESSETVSQLLADYADKNTYVKGLCDQYIADMQAGDESAANQVADEIEQYVVSSHDSSDCQVRNRCIVVDNINTAGGVGLSTEKEFISNEDLVLYATDNSPVITEQMSAYPEIDLSNGDVKQSNDDPYAIFDCQFRPQSGTDQGITNIGIEICLDHSDDRLRKNLTLNDQKLEQEGLQSVHLQIIPSCGMQIHASAVVADAKGQGGLVFNCDGEYELTDTNGVASLYRSYNGNTTQLPYTSTTYPDGLYTYQAHTQLARVATAAQGDTPGTDDATFDTNLGSDVDVQTYPVTAPSGFDSYFSGGAGEVHVYGVSSVLDLYS